MKNVFCRLSLFSALSFSVFVLPLNSQAQRLSLSDANGEKSARFRSSDTGQVYRMNYVRSLGFSAVAFAANLWATPNIIKDKKPLTDAELSALNPTIFNDFDEWALKQKDLTPERREKIDITSDRLLTLTTVGAASIFFNDRIRKDWTRVLALYLETSAATFALYSFSPLGPSFNDKIRPYAYYSNFPAADRKLGNSRNSLYSGHVANAAAASFFVAKVYSDYHPEIGKKKYILYGLATIPPALIGYLRVKALFHFPTDCVIGLLVGATTGIVIPETHRIKNKKGFVMGMSSLSDVPALALKYKF